MAELSGKQMQGVSQNTKTDEAETLARLLYVSLP